MLAVTRRNKIKEILLENKSVVVTDLSEQFHVAEETIRRDLKQLEQEGFLIRSYGGAFIQEGSTNKIDYLLRMESYVKAKKTIAKKAHDLIEHGDSIFLDDSTTSYYLAETLLDKRITVLTNSQIILSKISSYQNLNLLSTGGFFDKNTMSYSGKIALDTISNLYMDKSFFSCRMASVEKGLTDSLDESARLRVILMKNSKKNILLVDETKMNKISLHKISDLKNVDAIISNKSFPEKWINYSKKHNIDMY